MTRYLLIVVCALLLLGCDRKSPEIQQLPGKRPIYLSTQTKATTKPAILLQDPIDAIKVETPTEAILTWRRYQRQKPTLVLMSNDPFLEPVPTRLQPQATNLILNASVEKFYNKAVYLRSDSILFHHMALSAALNAKIFSKVVWIIPTPPEEKMLNLKKIRSNLNLLGYLSQKELNDLRLTGSKITGKIRKVPFILTSLKDLPTIKGPALFHIESSFFKNLYRNEIKTPLYGLIYNAFNSVKSKGWKVEAVTASSFTLGGNNSLAIRFLTNDIVSLLKKPNMLSSPPSTYWQYRSQAFYLRDLMQPEKELETYLKMEKLKPGDAAVKFALYETSRQLKHGNDALTYLDQAVSLDSGYGDEYLNLAMTAFSKKNKTATDKMLQKALMIDQKNPFSMLKAIPLYATMDMPNKAVPLLKKLQKMIWSPVYDPAIKEQLERWQAEITKRNGPAEKKDTP